jgi:hypothetical protein
MWARARGWLAWGLVLASAACTDDIDNLGGRLGADAGVPLDASRACDDGVACTEDAVAADGTCVHRPHDERCGFSECQVSRCQVGTGCVATPKPNGTLCADGPQCQPFVCQGGACMGVAAPDGLPCEDGDACTTQDRCQAGECRGEPGVSAPEVRARSYLVDDPPTGTFIRDRLAVEARAGERRVRWVVREGPQAAPMEDLGLFLAGSARFVRADAQRLLRLELNPVSRELTLEVIRDPGTPALESAFGIPVGRRSAGVPDLFTVTADHALFCADGPDGQPALHSVALLGGLPQGQPVPLGVPGPDLCSPSPSGGHAARGAYWARWEGGAAGPYIRVVRVEATTVETPISFSYAPDGIHAYGDIADVAVDEDGSVLMPVENRAWAYLFDARGLGGNEVVRLDRPAGARLLGLRGHRAIFQDGADLVLYELGDTSRIGVSRVQGRLSAGPARLLDASASRLAVVDGAGTLHWFDEGELGPYSAQVEVLGQGSLQDVTPLGGAVAGWSRRHLMRFTRGWLQRPTVAGAPVGTPRPDAPLVVISSRGDAILAGRPGEDTPEACGPDAVGRCPSDDPVMQDSLPVFLFTEPQLTRQGDLSDPVGPWGPSVARGRRAWHLESNAAGAAGLASARYTPLALLDDPAEPLGLDAAEVAGATLEAHEGALTVALPGGGAALIGGPDEGPHALWATTEGSARVLGAAWTPGRWQLLLAGEPSAPNRLRTYRVEAGQAVLTAEVPLEGYAARWLGHDGDRLYTETGGRVQVWQTGDDGAAQVVLGFESVSRPLRVVPSPAGALLVRPDGITVLSSACE